MRRAVLTAGGTVAGLAALFSFKTHSAVQAAAVAPEPSPLTTSATPATAASGSHSLASPKSTPTAKKPATTPASSAAATKAATPTAAPATKQPTASAGKSGTFTGSTENTQYGQVEVQITVSAGKITNASDLITPEDSIGSNAVGELNSEAVSAQSADIQAVSGATYTSQGYISSLQSAVDQAGL